MVSDTEAKTSSVFFFGREEAEGSAEMVDLLGGKGSNLAEMSRIGVPVPPGFTISTEVCRSYYRNQRQFPEGLRERVDESLRRVEQEMGKQFGDPTNPLLFSVRSGAPVSMPGMMDTVLNLGLNHRAVEGLASRSDDPRFAYDCYRRLIQMYGDVCMGLDGTQFEERIERKKQQSGVENDTDLTPAQLQELAEEFKELIREETGRPFPDDPMEQLWGGITAVFESWNNERAVKWREINNLPHDVGTAVNVQAMVFGNMGSGSATGVAFTRDAATGEPELNGEYLPNAQGEDVVAGVRTPCPLNEYERRRTGNDLPTLEGTMPSIYRRLCEVLNTLEQHYRDMQDVEFTIQQGELFILQTRTGKRTARAMVKIAHDLSKEGVIDRKKALDRIEAERLDQLLHPMITERARQQNDPLADGLGASPGGAVGQVVFDAETAQDWQRDGRQVILVRRETSPDDIGGMDAAQGILTSRGGGTSHAAVVARGMGKPCVTGCGAIRIDYQQQSFSVNGINVQKGDWITLDGTSGRVYQGRLGMKEPELSGEFETVMGWTDEFRSLNVRTNADTPEDARQAREFGAQGIGLCRTEHMFFEPERISHMRHLILVAPDVQNLRLRKEELEQELNTAPKQKLSRIRTELEQTENRLEGVLPTYRGALDKLLPEQQEDFYGIFRAMDGYPVTVRLLDPPLHEFLPHGDEERDQIARQMEVPRERIDELVENLTEFNPMLGHRGCRLGMTYPEVYEMQTRAIVQAAVESREEGIDVQPEIMIPLVALPEELKVLRERVEQVVDTVLEERGADLDVQVGTMIELPRAALMADDIAPYADFFSFGTNDLTQTTFGISRDDSAGFLEHYQQLGLIDHDPFAVLDRKGVGRLIEMAVHRGREFDSTLKLGICGEHGGEPSSVRFCHEAGLDYVSCSPYRIPIARMAAAQAAIDVEQDLTTY